MKMLPARLALIVVCLAAPASVLRAEDEDDAGDSEEVSAPAEAPVETPAAVPVPRATRTLRPADGRRSAPPPAASPEAESPAHSWGGAGVSQGSRDTAPGSAKTEPARTAGGAAANAAGSCEVRDVDWHPGRGGDFDGFRSQAEGTTRAYRFPRRALGTQGSLQNYNPYTPATMTITNRPCDAARGAPGHRHPVLRQAARHAGADEKMEGAGLPSLHPPAAGP